MARRKSWISPAIGLTLAGILTVGALATPAGAHLTTFSHLKQHFYTKKAARATFLQNTKTVVAFDSLPGGAGSQDTATVDCPTGWQATGGGLHFQSNYPDVNVTWNGPLIQGDNIVAADPGINGRATGWKVQVENTVVSSFTYAVAVICSK